MKYGSVCSGIEAATVAWHGLGWQPQWFSEIEAFPSAVLARHYPQVPNKGDMTKFKEWGLTDGSIDLLVGGTPCQSFSVAGLRAGLRDPRGSLMLTYLAIAATARPRWLVWENVPGVLSSHGGRDFGAFLGSLAELGYGFAYRVLDAQHFGVPQRRRRVFVVGHLGDWRRAAAVLFERESLLRNPAPGRKAREDTSGRPSFGISPDCFDRDGEGAGGTAAERSGLGVDRELAYALRAKRAGGVAHHVEAFGGNNTAGPIDIATARNACGSGSGRLDFESETFITHTLRGEGFDASEDGTGRGTPLVPVAFHSSQDPDVSGDVTHPCGRNGGLETCIAFSAKDYGGDAGEIAPMLRAGGHANSHANAGVMPAIQQAMQVRRLTPRECERLQGFPDGYTHITYRKKPAADGPRYKAIGNSMAVPVMRWIGERIQMVEAIK